MILWFILLGTVLSVPTDEFKELTNDVYEDFEQNGDKVNNIVPSRLISSNIPSQSNPYTSTAKEQWSEIKNLIGENRYLNLFNIHIEKGVTSKGLTFCIYNNDMREAAINLFRLFQTTEGETFDKLKDWTKYNINKEMYMYALRLESLYSSKTNSTSLLPPFVWNPHYFVNSEALSKASLIVNDLMVKGEIDSQMSKTDQYSYLSSSVVKKFAIINSNYSGWNLPKNEKADQLNYFREDVALNSYYLGLHLLHPFWMSNEELEFNNPRYAEHYYYAHQKLLARYNLEKEHRLVENSSFKADGWDYTPYLKYKNGLPFPRRYCSNFEWKDEKAFIKNVDIAILECVSRGLLIMENGTYMTMKDDSHINILAKLIRANIDGIKFAEISRSIVGYGEKYPLNEYTPAPSILHHPETSLNDPAYWLMIKAMLDYFIGYKNTMEPFDLSEYETKEFGIVKSNFSKLETKFEDFEFSLNFGTSNNIIDANDWPAYVAVRQRRLIHKPFSLNFTVESIVSKNAIVRLYLGPECNSNHCWDIYDRFFELDTFPFALQKGLNLVSWYPETSDNYSNDKDYNNVLPKTGSTKYSIFRFPESLLLPKGHNNGLNLTLFVMITPADDNIVSFPPTSYREVSNEADFKPLGFPFHRYATGFNDLALNYRFYNISIYHEKTVPYNGYFSRHLY